MTSRKIFLLVTIILCTFGLANCSADQTPPTTSPANSTVTPAHPRPSATPTLQATPTTAQPPTLAVSAESDHMTGNAISDAAKQVGLKVDSDPEHPLGDVAIWDHPLKDGQVLMERYYAIVDWFPSFRTNITSEDILNLWNGTPTPDGITTLLMNPDTLAAFTQAWGKPKSNVQSVPDNKLVDTLWANHKALAFMPFDQLVPKVKALHVDDRDITDRDAKLDYYQLVIRLYVSGAPTYVKGLMSAFQKKVPFTNRDPQRITKLIMTGVTAISRTSAFKIDASGDPALPARKVADVMKAADITHVSNEVPFTDKCTPVLGTLQLCSKPSYIASFQLAGVDIVSSTGNHMNDYGIQAFRDTLDLYEKDGFKWFGGGRDIDDASKVLVMQDHGNKIAFLGMNSFGPVSVWATKDRPGAQKYDKDILHQELAQARKEADVVFLDMQADETYEYTPNANNIELFHDGIRNGADVVTGVQAHQPQAIEFTPDDKHLILYGLGNLWFDQMQTDGVRQGLVVRHTIYAGHVIQTELLPTILEDYVQPRWATPDETKTILGLVFDASNFK